MPKKKEAVISIEIPEHGLYNSTVEQVDAAVKRGRVRLLEGILEAYVDGNGEHRTERYWSKYSTTVLAIVFAGIYNPHT